jgi:hypothetical protein
MLLAGSKEPHLSRETPSLLVMLLDELRFWYVLIGIFGKGGEKTAWRTKTMTEG